MARVKSVRRHSKLELELMNERDILSWRLVEMAQLNNILAAANNKAVEMLLLPRKQHRENLFFGTVICDALKAVYGE